MTIFLLVVVMKYGLSIRALLIDMRNLIIS
jgi:hypothetical protein